MNGEQLRYEVEQRAVAICLAFSAACFLTGAALQYGSRAVSKALTWGGIQ